MKHLLSILLTFTASVALAQHNTVDNPRLDFNKQQITYYTDSAFQTKKVASTDFLKLRLIAWKNGGWEAVKSGLSSQPVDTVYIKDDQFVKTPEYRVALEEYEPSFKAKHEAYHRQLVKTYGKKIGDGIYFGVPVVGMNYRQFYMCRDKADQSNITNTANGRSEQLVYRFGAAGTKYYYFTNGKLTAIQD